MKLPAVAAAPRPEHPFFKADPARPGRGIGRPVERRSARRSERQRVEGRVGRGEPGLHALAFEQAERLRALAIVDRLPEAGVVHVDLAHAGFVQARQRDHMGAVGRRLGERRGGEQLREIAATAVVLHHDVIGLAAEGVDQRAEQFARILAVVEDVPEIHGDAHFLEDAQQVRLLDPAGQRRQRLGGEVDDRALLRVGLETGHDRVESLEAVDHHGRGEALVEAREGRVRAVGVEARERPAVVDEVLRQDPRDDGFADAAFFAADEIDGAHGMCAVRRRGKDGEKS